MSALGRVAPGLALRMLGHGRRVGVVQFVKGAWHTGEKDAYAVFGDRVEWHSMGEGFTWETQDRARDIAAADGLEHLSVGGQFGGELSVVFRGDQAHRSPTAR